MVATQNIDTLGAIWTFFTLGLLTLWPADKTLMAVCCFEETANLHS